MSVINSAGIVTGIYVTYGVGVGYQDPPTITIAGPVGFETGTGVGRFIFNEIVTGSTSGTTSKSQRVELGHLQVGSFHC